MGRTGWGIPLPAGQARGTALHASLGSIVAQQMEGAVVCVLTAAVCGQIDIHDGVGQQKNLPE